jgi:hypothetical protein
LVGWKKGGVLASYYRGHTSVKPASAIYLPQWETDYTCPTWCHNTSLAILVGGGASVSSSVVSGGMACAARNCGAFNDYAVPNMPDGSYVCYTCRQRPACMR